MRLIDADVLATKIRHSGKTHDWKDLNYMMQLLNETPTILDVVPKPKKEKKSKIENN